MRTSAPSRTGSSVRQRSRARRPATLKLTGSVNTCRPHTAQHRAKQKTRTRDHANLACPIQQTSFRFSAEPEVSAHPRRSMTPRSTRSASPERWTAVTTVTCRTVLPCTLTLTSAYYGLGPDAGITPIRRAWRRRRFVLVRVHISAILGRDVSAQAWGPGGCVDAVGPAEGPGACWIAFAACLLRHVRCK